MNHSWLPMHRVYLKVVTDECKPDDFQRIGPVTQLRSNAEVLRFSMCVLRGVGMDDRSLSVDYGLGTKTRWAFLCLTSAPWFAFSRHLRECSEGGCVKRLAKAAARRKSWRVA